MLTITCLLGAYQSIRLGRGTCDLSLSLSLSLYLSLFLSLSLSLSLSLFPSLSLYPVSLSHVSHFLLPITQCNYSLLKREACGLYSCYMRFTLIALFVYGACCLSYLYWHIEMLHHMDRHIPAQSTHQCKDNTLSVLVINYFPNS